MSRLRNAVIIIILCIIGAYTVRKGPQLGMSLPGAQDLKDAIAGGPSQRPAGGLQPILAGRGGEELRDAVAGHPVGTPQGTNTLGDVDGPPRGNGYGGISPLANNYNVPLNNPPPLLSSSAPNNEINP